MASFSFSKSNLPKQLFINNEFVNSKSPHTLTVHNPVDGSVLADDVALAGEQDVDDAVDAAVKAFPSWKKLSASKRRDIMYKFASLIEEHSVALAELTRISLGAPRAGFGPLEVGLAAEVCGSSSCASF